MAVTPRLVGREEVTFSEGRILHTEQPRAPSPGSGRFLKVGDALLNQRLTPCKGGKGGFGVLLSVALPAYPSGFPCSR